MADETDNNSWSEWRKHVLLEIERINKNLEKLSEKHTAVCLEVAKLKVYAAIWGGVGGAIITGVILIAVAGG